MAADDVFFPEAIQEVIHTPPLPPSWSRYECYLWHDFLVAEGVYDVPTMFEHYRGKHSYKMRKLRALGGRRIFVLSNTRTI